MVLKTFSISKGRDEAMVGNETLGPWTLKHASSRTELVTVCTWPYSTCFRRIHLSPSPKSSDEFQSFCYCFSSWRQKEFYALVFEVQFKGNVGESLLDGEFCECWVVCNIQPRIYPPVHCLPICPSIYLSSHLYTYWFLHDAWHYVYMLGLQW